MFLKIFFASCFLIVLCAGQHANPADLDPLDEINEDEFEEFFNVERPADPEEYEKRKEALKENEKEIHRVNEEFEAGDISWFDAVNEFSDLPGDEFVKQHTGAIANFTEGRGLLNPLQADMTPEHMDLFHLSRTKEHVDPVLPSPAWPQLKLVSARLLESLEIMQNSKWLTVDIRRMEPMVAMVLHLMPTSSTGETTN